MELYNKAHSKCKAGQKPIFLAEVEFIKQGRIAKKDLTLSDLIKKRGLTNLLLRKKSNVSLHKVKNIVCSGLIEDIKTSKDVMHRVISAYHKYDKDRKKIANNYDYSRIKIKEVKFIKLLGYGKK